MQRPLCTACAERPAVYAKHVGAASGRDFVFSCGRPLCAQALVFSAKQPTRTSTPTPAPTPLRDVSLQEAQRIIKKSLTAALKSIEGALEKSLRKLQLNPAPDALNVFWSTVPHVREVCKGFITNDMQGILKMIDVFTNGKMVRSTVPTNILVMDRVRMWMDKDMSGRVLAIARSLVNLCHAKRISEVTSPKDIADRLRRVLAYGISPLVGDFKISLREGENPAVTEHEVVLGVLGVYSLPEIGAQTRLHQNLTSEQKKRLPKPYDRNDDRTCFLAVLQLVWVAFAHMARELMLTAHTQDLTQSLASIAGSMRFFRDMYVGPSTIGVDWTSYRRIFSAGQGAFTYRTLANLKARSNIWLPKPVEDPFFGQVLGVYDYDPVLSIGLTTLSCIDKRARLFRPDAYLAQPAKLLSSVVTGLEDVNKRHWILVPEHKRTAEVAPNTTEETIPIVYMRDEHSHWWQGAVPKSRYDAIGFPACVTPPWSWVFQPRYSLEVWRASVAGVKEVYVLDPTIWDSVRVRGGSDARAPVATFDSLVDLQDVDEDHVRTPWVVYLQEPLEGSVANCFLGYLPVADVNRLLENKKFSRSMTHPLAVNHCCDGSDHRADIYDCNSPTGEERVLHNEYMGHGFTQIGLSLCCFNPHDRTVLDPGMELFLTYSANDDADSSLNHGYRRGATCIPEEFRNIASGREAVSGLIEATQSQESQAEFADLDVSALMRPCDMRVGTGL